MSSAPVRGRKFLTPNAQKRRQPKAVHVKLTRKKNPQSSTGAIHIIPKRKWDDKRFFKTLRTPWYKEYSETWYLRQQLTKIPPKYRPEYEKENEDEQSWSGVSDNTYTPSPS